MSRASATPVRRGAERWGSWHPVASGFHFGTKDTRWATDDETELITAEQRRRAPGDPPPTPFKQPRGRGLALPMQRAASEFTTVLRDRRTWRGFGRKPMTRTQLGHLLDLTFGARMHGTGPAGSPWCSRPPRQPAPATR